ncbi:hypothetical protein BX285_1209 [Streptomyces sp. 1114.5]|uniref:hypothetical protein n=1 Tax=Streptomyces sp. 1114.5 TaxID=1938830 RepID=UPI000F19CA51|nr:hypothetical protein [Streptomyces sp. 1114.5]RKT16854.1 hypothetical protein BX285_1209 [Streptomyces sp. 1114.5]
MLITGHENAPLISGEELLALPGFWAAYLLWLAEGEDFEPEPALFGADGADLDAAYERLSDPAAWPVIRLPIQHGHTILIVHRNFTEDEGIDYYVAHPDWDRPRSLASIEGHFSGPGLAWSELVHVARRPGDGPGITDPDARLLLLLPILGDVDLSADATATVARILAAIGTPPEAAATLADALLDHPFWDGETWFFEGSSPLSGASTATHLSRVLLCGGSYSPRGVRFGLSPDQDARLAEALGTAG